KSSLSPFLFLALFSFLVLFVFLPSGIRATISHKPEFRRKCLTPRSVCCRLQMLRVLYRLRCGLRAFHFYRRSDAMLPIEEAIIEKLRNGPCLFDDVVSELSKFSWGEVFVAVERMSQDGKGDIYFFKSAASMGSEGISLRVRERRRSNRPATRREMVRQTKFQPPFDSQVSNLRPRKIVPFNGVS